MQVEAVVESVEVTASAITIDPTETSSSGSVGVSTMDNAPKVNKSYQDVMPLIPGVLRGRQGEINLNGVRATQSGSQLNSVDMTDPVARTSQLTLPLSVISNVQVLSTPYDAQYGGFAGAVSTVETKPANLEKFRAGLQNFGPRIRRRDGAIMGIESFTPRFTANVPIKKGRFGLLHATEYQFVRADQEDAKLPLLERDVERESLSIYTQFDAQLTQKNLASISLLIFPEKNNFFGLNAFTVQPATPDLRRRGKLLNLRDTHLFESGALLLTNASYQDLDHDVLPRSYEASVLELETTRGAFFNRQARRTERGTLSAQYQFAPRGPHQIKTGVQMGRETYQGNMTFNPIAWLGVDQRLVSRLDFTDPTTVNATKNEIADVSSGQMVGVRSADARPGRQTGTRLHREGLESVIPCRIRLCFRRRVAHRATRRQRTLHRPDQHARADLHATAGTHRNAFQPGRRHHVRPAVRSRALMARFATPEALAGTYSSTMR